HDVICPLNPALHMQTDKPPGNRGLFFAPKSPTPASWIIRDVARVCYSIANFNFEALYKIMLLINSFLLLNGLLYIVLGLWCAIRPQQTASSVGFTLESTQGLVEYVTVYGGLEFALGVFFLYCALRPDYAGAGVIFGLCLYGGLAIFRTIALGVHGS